MSISISQRSYDELLREAQTNIQVDPTDKQDVVWQYPELLGRGSMREIELREGLFIHIYNFQLQDRLKINDTEYQTQLRYHFHLLGHHKDYDTTVNNREFAVYGSGYNPAESTDAPPQTALEVTLFVEPEILLSFVGDDGQLPQQLQHLIEPGDRLRYARVGKITPRLESVLWQILRCPYRGMTKRIYLEGKALELMALVIEQEVEIYQGERSLKLPTSETIDRIHYAQTILLQNISNPPTIAELAKQVQVNEYTLKCGFRDCFNTTIFRYIHNCRLEQAKQLLDTGDMRVAEVMNAVGFRDRHNFAAAFRKKFYVNPRDYLMQSKRSL